MKVALSIALICALFLCATSAESVAQTYQGGVRGVVRDTGGAVIPGAELTLVNPATGLRRHTVTNERGDYVFSQLPPGTYTLTVVLSGFTTKELTEIIVGVQTFHVIDVSMEVGGIAEAITVTGESPVIETATASVASEINKAQLDILPSPGRNVFIYSVTTPNVIHVGDPVFVRKQDQTNSSLLSLAGGPLRGNNYTVDGVAITDMRNRAVVIPNNDAVEEMKVQVNTYDSEMGRTGGGVFNVLHRSGSNNWAGSGLWQTRPQFGRGLLFFEQAEQGGSGEAPEAPYNLWSFAGGGPIVEDKTFFWASYEGYKNTDTRNAVVILPTRAMLNGDFSGTGRTIYDPLTFNPATGARQPFPGGVIPADRMDPVGQELMELLLGIGEGPTNATALLNNTANEPTFKIDHRFSDNLQISGTYMYYKSQEPANKFYAAIQGGEVPSFDTGASVLFRDVNVLAINLTNVASESSVMTFRYGYTRFGDSFLSPEFDISELPFSERSIQALQDVNRFPYITVEGYGETANELVDATHGSWQNTDVVWKSQELSGTYSKFVGSHTIKVGAQYRRIGVDTFLPGYGAEFHFTPGFTNGPDPLNPAAGSGDAFASVLLGFPDSGSAVKATPTDVFINYYGGYIQDDWRFGDKLVLNLGLRIEHEDGLAEKEDRFAVGFDRNAPFPVQVPGLDLRGGLTYPGTNGASTTQSDPKSVKLGPRGGFVYAFNDRTVLRGGYGIFWAPHQYPNPGETTFGTRGFTAVTPYTASFDGINPASPGSGSPGSLTDPYPTGIDQPVGSSLGLLTGAGATIHFNDQFAPSPYIQQWSVDVQRELGTAWAIKVGYLGSKGTDLWIGGSADGFVNINQLDPQHLSRGSDLNDPVRNPFFGNPVFGSLAASPTIARGQLLRPYPQFLDLWAHHVGAGKSRYDAVRVELEKKFGGTWGARVNYTYSRTRDNILYRTGSDGNTRVSDLRREAFRSFDLDEDPLPRSPLDSPHWLNINGMYRFPAPSGGAAERILGGWSASVAAIIRSGFPVTFTQSNNNLGSEFGFSHQRPNIVGDPSVSGSTEDKVSNYFNPAAFQDAPSSTFGNAPLTFSDYRTPPLLNWDVSFDKETSLGGGASLLLRFEFINLFSQPNWNGPRSIFGSSNFGQIQGVGGFPRTFQFMAKVSF